ncbi:hypothetical protein [Methylorubrum aminovorans]|uniref:hypothetical protein n=1 Tax=Methylorubrum aminovorans TaxID=269069 RepID=UPI0024E104EE|nr:hypothetical protein [Methylorubrum aminovorans]
MMLPSISARSCRYGGTIGRRWPYSVDGKMLEMKKNERPSHWDVPDSLKLYADFLERAAFFSDRASRDYILAARNIIRCYPELMNLVKPDVIDAQHFRVIKELVSISRQDEREGKDQVGIERGENETFAEVPAGRVAYYRASTTILREKISGPRNTINYQRLSARESHISAVASLQEHFERNTSAIKLISDPSEVQHYNLFQISIIEFGYDSTFELRSNYATHCNDTNVLRSDFHDSTNPFFSGPYLDLAPGIYRLEMTLRSSQPSSVKLNIMRKKTHTNAVIHAEHRHLIAGENQLTIEFTWNHELNGGVYESVLRVNDNIFLSLELKKYNLVYVAPSNH